MYDDGLILFDPRPWGSYVIQSWAGRSVYTVYWFLFHYPLQQLYLRGYWQSRTPEDICASITQYKADFWHEHPVECDELIYNHFDSYLVWIQMAAYVLVLARFCRFFISSFSHGILAASRKKSAHAHPGAK